MMTDREFWIEIRFHLVSRAKGGPPSEKPRDHGYGKSYAGVHALKKMAENIDRDHVPSGEGAVTIDLEGPTADIVLDGDYDGPKETKEKIDP